MVDEITVESTYIETNEQYKQGVSLSEYKGTYSLASVNESKQGGRFLQWVYPKLKDGAAKKEIPWQCRLGNAKQARQILQQYADLLKEIDDDSVSNTPF